MQTEYCGEGNKGCIAKAKQTLSWWEWLELTYYRYTLESAVYVMSKEEGWMFNSTLLILLIIILRGVYTWISALLV